MKSIFKIMGFLLGSLLIAACQPPNQPTNSSKAPSSEETMALAEFEMPPSLPFPSQTARNVEKDWNLVSLPIDRVTSSLDFLQQFPAISSIWKWDNSIQAWKTFPQLGNFQELHSVNPDDGYWIRVRYAFDLTQTHNNVTNQYVLTSGWNLLGISHSATTQTITNFFANADLWDGGCSVVSYESVWAWTSDNKWAVHFADSQKQTEFLEQYTNIGELTQLEAGMGIWVHTQSQTAPPNQTGCPTELKKTYLAAGNHYSVLVNPATGKAYAMGENARAQLGISWVDPNAPNSQVYPHMYEVQGLDGVNIQQIHNGMNHTAIITDTSDLYTWGLNNSGAAGLGTSATDPTLVVTAGCREVPSNSFFDDKPNSHICEARKIPTLSQVTAFSGGNGFSLAYANGSVYGWGENDLGQLGLGHQDHVYHPIEITGMDGITVVDFATGISHSLALTNQGKVYAWGSNRDGQIGQGDNADDVILTPMQVQGLDNVTIVAVGIGNYNSFAITDTGALYAWGENLYAQLGNGEYGNETNKSLPTLINLPSGVKAAAVHGGSRHTHMLSQSGDVYSWGRLGANGQLGIGLTEDSDPIYYPTPQLIEGLDQANIIEIGGGVNHMFALTEDMKVYAWGSNAHGRLGFGQEGDLSVDYPSPTLVSFDRALSAIPTVKAQQLQFIDTDSDTGELGGTLVVQPASEESTITHYVVYWGTENGEPLADMDPLVILPKTGMVLESTLLENTSVPSTATHLVVVTKNGFGEMSTGVVAPIVEKGAVVSGTSFSLSEYLGAIYFDGTQFVVATGDGLIFTSIDGLEWNFYASGLEGIRGLTQAADGNPYIGVGGNQNAAIVRSTNGTSWSNASTIPDGADSLLAIERLGDTGFVASGNSHTVLVGNASGSTWTEVDLDTMISDLAPLLQLRSVAYNQTDEVVIVGALGTILSSSDSGTTWNKVTSPTTQALREVVWDGNQFVAVGNLGTVVTSISTDWVTRTSTGDQSWNGLAFAEVDGTKTYVAVARVNQISTSNDLDQWQDRNTSGGFTTLTSVAYGNGKFIAVGSSSTILISSDLGNSWSQVTPKFNFNQNFSTVRLAGDTIVMAANNLVLSSGDSGGLQWSPLETATTNEHSPLVFYDAAPLNDKLWIGASSSRIINVDLAASEPDWEVVTMPVSGKTVNSVASDGQSTLVAAANKDGDHGLLFLSTDSGTTWSSQTITDLDQNLLAAGFGENRFVAAGKSGTVVTALSTDLSTWSSGNSNGFDKDINDIAYGNQCWVMAGDDYTSDSINYLGVLISSNGTDFQPLTLQGEFNLESVAFGNGVFVVVGQDGKVYRSEDVTSSNCTTALMWTEISTDFQTTEDLTSVEYLNGYFVVVGKAGTYFHYYW